MSSVAVLLLALASPAWAHGEIAAVSPGFGSEVGGEVADLDLYFTTGLTSVEVSLEAPDGSLVDGTIEQPEPSVARFVFDPLTQEGQYLVRYEMIDSDNDVIDGAFAFTYTVTAPPPADIASPASSFLIEEPPEDGASTALLAIVGVLTLVIVGLAVPLAEKLRRARELES